MDTLKLSMLIGQEIEDLRFHYVPENEYGMQSFHSYMMLGNHTIIDIPKFNDDHLQLAQDSVNYLKKMFDTGDLVNDKVKSYFVGQKIIDFCFAYENDDVYFDHSAFIKLSNNYYLTENNFGPVGLSDIPDLVIINPLINATSISAGDTVVAAFTAQNRGTVNTGANKIYFYLSSDSLLTPNANGDMLLSTYAFNTTLTAGSNSGLINKKLIMPCSIATGNYHLLIVADAENSIEEEEESNNTAETSFLANGFQVSVKSSDTTVCEGASVTLTAEGASSYNWSPSATLNDTKTPTVIATPLDSTTYYVTGMLNACFQKDSVVVLVKPSIAPSVQISFAGCPSDTLLFEATAINAGSNVQYQWFVNDEKVDTASKVIFRVVSNGDVIVCKIRSDESCAYPDTASAMLSVNCVGTVGYEGIEGLQEFRLTPNPSNQFLTISLKLSEPKELAFTLADYNGGHVYKIDPVVRSGIVTQTITLGNKPSGIYYLQTTVGNKNFIRKIIVIR